MDEAARAAPYPPVVDDVTAHDVIAYHAARGSATQWIHSRAQATPDTSHRWTDALDTAIRGHYATAGLIAHIAGAAGNTTAHEAARQVTNEGLDHPESATVLLTFITDTLGAEAATRAEERLRADIGNGFYTEAIDRLARRYGVGYWLHLDCVATTAENTS